MIEIHNLNAHYQRAKNKSQFLMQRNHSNKIYGIEFQKLSKQNSSCGATFQDSCANDDKRDERLFSYALSLILEWCIQSVCFIVCSRVAVGLCVVVVAIQWN